MKTAAKVCLIIGMVCGFWMILPLIFGILAINKINTATKKDELVGMGVCAILFCSTLGGIFMLCITDEELQSNVQYVQPEYVDNQNNQVEYVVESQEQSNKNTENKEQNPDIDNVELLSRYKNLLDKGIISQEEYEQKKEEILKNCL